MNQSDDESEKMRKELLALVAMAAMRIKILHPNSDPKYHDGNSKIISALNQGYSKYSKLTDILR